MKISKAGFYFAIITLIKKQSCMSALQAPLLLLHHQHILISGYMMCFQIIYVVEMKKSHSCGLAVQVCNIRA